MTLTRLWILLLVAAFTLAVPAQTKKTAGKKSTVATTKKTTTAKKTTTTAKKTATTQKKTTTAVKKTTAATATKTASKKEPQTISGLKDERAQVNKEIAAQKQKLSNNERLVKERLQSLMLLNNEISDKKETISTIRKEINKLDGDIARFDKQLKTLEAELKDNKDKYVKSLRYMHRNRADQNQLMFIFSADNFSQMYRRMRFMREYATYQRQQGERVKRNQTEVANKRAELRKARRLQSQLLARGETEQKSLEGKQKDQQKMVSTLQRQQTTIRNIIVDRQRRSEEIERRIDELVAIEVEKARRAAEAEASSIRKDIDRKKQNGEQLTTAEAETERRYSEVGMVTAADYKLNGTFAANRGKLPIPVTGSYRIVNRFGNYNVDGLKNVRLNNKGVNILAQKGARVRCVFDGVVSQVFRLPGTNHDGVIVRHGSYMSVYWPVTSTRVKKGQRVAAREQLGVLAGDNVLEFQLRKEKALLDPEPWLGK